MLELSGRTVSTLGNGMYTVTLAWTVYHITRSGHLMAVVLLVNEIPELALLLFGGVIGDRYSRRLIIMVSDGTALLATSMLTVAGAFHVLGPPELLAAAFLLGAASALFLPAYGAINRDLLPPEELAMGNALRNSANDVARICGPVLGGVAYALGGPQLAFGSDAASFGVAIVTMFLVRLPPARAAFDPAAPREILGGLRVLRQNRWLRTVLVVTLTANTVCLAPLLVLLPLIVRDAGYPASFLGLALATESILSAVFSLFVGRLSNRLHPGVTLCSLAAVMGAGACVIGVFPGQRLAILLGAGLVGIGFAAGVTEDTVIQHNVPREYLSRVYSLNTLAAFALLPAGYLLAGTLSGVTGPGAVLAIGGAMLGALSLLSIARRDIRDLRAVPEGLQAGPGDVFCVNSSERTE
jgi:MFS family permease